MNQIPGDKIQMTPVKAFSTAKDAKDEAQGILAPAVDAKKKDCKCWNLA